MDKHKQTVLYFYHLQTSFTDIDYGILNSRFNVKLFEFGIKGKGSIFFLWIRQIMFLIRNIQKTDLVFCMFAGYHTFIPVLFCKLFRKPVIIVAGGIDCVAFPSINYGNFSKKILGKITEFSFRNCTHIAPISEYLVNSEYTFYKADYPRQGIYFFCENLKTPFTVIYNGFNIEKWNNTGKERKKNSFLTIASNLDNPVRMFVKGIDLILEAALLLPECSFTIIGKSDSALNPPPNVTVIPPMPYDALCEIYNAHEFYLQLSISEGFGNTLGESMLCECVPIGSDPGAIPMIIDGCGFILQNKNAGQFVSLIRQALQSDKKELGKKARTRVIENFSFEIRKQRILNLIDSVNIL